MRLQPAGINAVPAGAQDEVHHDELTRRLQELLG